MATFLYCGIPLHGHTNPTLSVMKELVGRGTKVTYYSTEEFRERIEATGVEYRSYGEDLDLHSTLKERGPGSILSWLFGASARLKRRLMADFAGESPACIIHDSFCIWGPQLALTWNIPEICFLTTFAFDVTSRVLRIAFPLFLFRKVVLNRGGIRNMFHFAREFGFELANPVYLFQSRQALKIVFSSQYFQPGDGFDDSFKFIGYSLSSRDESADFAFDEPKKVPLIYVSLGTIHHEFLSFYQTCFEALGTMEARVIMSVGHKTDINTLGAIPKNFTVKNYVQQVQVLSRASLFITHGGMNSTSEGLYFNVPLIVIPTVGDQKSVARCVESLGAGIRLRRRGLTASKLSRATEQVLSGESYRKNAKLIGESLRTAGGPQLAADEILRFIQEWPRRGE
jgi:MGT family glycosyltransferase